MKPKVFSDRQMMSMMSQGAAFLDKSIYLYIKADMDSYDIDDGVREMVKYINSRISSDSYADENPSDR